MFINNVFSFVWAVSYAFAFEVSIKCKYEPKLFLQISVWLSKNAEFHADFKSLEKVVITSNVPVVFMARYVMVLRSATSLRGALEGLGPENRDFFGPWNDTSEASAIWAQKSPSHLPPKKVSNKNLIDIFTFPTLLMFVKLICLKLSLCIFEIFSTDWKSTWSSACYDTPLLIFSNNVILLHIANFEAHCAQNVKKHYSVNVSWNTFCIYQLVCVFIF